MPGTKKERQPVKAGDQSSVLFSSSKLANHKTRRKREMNLSDLEEQYLASAAPIACGQVDAG